LLQHVHTLRVWCVVVMAQAVAVG